MSCIVCNNYKPIMTSINKISDEILEFLLIKKSEFRMVEKVNLCFECYLKIKREYNLEKSVNKIIEFLMNKGK